MFRLILIAVFSMLSWLPVNAQSQRELAATNSEYPRQPIRLIIPFAPGGATDLVGRQLAKGISESIGQPVIVENKPGAGGNIGAQTVAVAKPDGYTILLGSMGPLVINQFLQSSLTFNPRTDFSPITNLVSVNNVLVVSSDFPVRNVSSLIEFAKTNPGKLNYASSGLGATDHLAGELFNQLARVDTRHIPFKGGVAAVASILAGDTQMSFATAPTVLGHIASGRLRALGVTGITRLEALPGVPTIAEDGLPEFDVTTWFGLLAPAGTNATIIARLNQEALRVMSTPSFRESMTKNGLQITPTTPVQFQQQIDRDTIKWEVVIKKAGIRAQ